MEFLHHGGIFDHGKVKTEDDGLIPTCFREDRVNLMIKTACAEFQKQGKVRFQFLCIVMDSSYTEPDEPLKKFPDGDEDIHKIIERDGEVFLAPIAVRSPGAHSSRERDFRLDNTKICHPITTRLADEFQYCYHVTEMANMNGIIKEGLQPGGHRGGRTQVFLNPFAPWDERYKTVF